MQLALDSGISPGILRGMDFPRAPVLPLVILGLLTLGAPSLVAAGDVVSASDGSSLELTSGDGDESLTITGIDATSVQVTPNAPTTLNGSADPQTFPARSVTVDLGLGVHTVVVNGLSGGERFLDVDGDVGDETVTVSQSDLETVRFRLGGGANSASVTDSTIDGKLVYRGQDGTDRLSVLRTTVTQNVDVNGGGGTNTVEADAVQAGALLVEGGGGNDELYGLDTTLAKRVRIDLGGGDNLAKLTRLTSESLSYFGGAGGDTLQLDTVAVTTGKVIVNAKGGDNFLIATGFGIAKSLSFKGGFGADTVRLTDSTVGEGFEMKVAGGANELELQNTPIAEHVTYRGGKDVDVVQVGGGTVSEAVVVDLGGAGNTFATVGATLGPLTVKSRNGIDVVTLATTHVTGNVKLTLSAGQNATVLDAATIDGDFMLKTGAQDDSFSILVGTVIAGKQTIKLGGGTNTIVAP